MTAEIFHPETYTHAVPHDRFADLRRTAPVCWIDEPAVGAWPAGPGYWGVFAHADVKRVLRDPQTFSSHLGGTQIRDPETPADLGFVRAMMLNQDPPAQSRLRRIVAAAFTPRAIRALEETIADRARALVNAALPAGRADFVEVAADLPVWTPARIMGVPDEDRRLLYDWANRVIGYQDADYAGLSTADAAALSLVGVLQEGQEGAGDAVAEGLVSGHGEEEEHVLELVVVYHASANRDETVFQDPDRLDLTRTPNDHVTFGFGPHYCLGAHLAKTQMRAMLGQVLTRMPHIRPDGDPVRLTSNFQNGLKRLPVRWD